MSKCKMKASKESTNQKSRNVVRWGCHRSTESNHDERSRVNRITIWIIFDDFLARVAVIGVEAAHSQIAKAKSIIIVYSDLVCI